MNARCFDSNNMSYHNYGGRGIEVCHVWKNDYAAFELWALNHGYKSELTLDRIDNDGNYEPQNCRWITRKLNARNKRNNKIISAFNEEKCLAEWAEDDRCRVCYSTLKYRLLHNWLPEEAITFLPNKRYKRNP